MAVIPLYHKAYKNRGLRMPFIKTKAKIEKGTLKAKVKYPLVGGAELEIGPISKLKAIVKIPFVASAKFFGIYKAKKGKEK